MMASGMCTAASAERVFGLKLGVTVPDNGLHGTQGGGIISYSGVGARPAPLNLARRA